MDGSHGSSERTLKVLMQNRPNAFSERGGDTVLMEQLANHLKGLGVSVDIDLTGNVSLTNYDLVHLFNFATPQITETLARRAHQAGVPYVVTALYEDLPQFFNQKIALFQSLLRYLSSGQPREKWQEISAGAKNVTPSQRWENTWTAQHAGCLIASGQKEKEALLRDYPQTRRINVCHTGCEISGNEDRGALFFQETGVRDAVLCVGRLETRKNQLMILKALEDVDLPVVFITGGFTYQKDYEEACKRFQRRGQTMYLGRVTPELLASAYQACRVHVLPSFYELPGIVSLEAARYGANVVATENGTTREYLGDYAYYCDPTSAESIRNAVLAGYYAPKRIEMKQQVQHFTWNNSAREVLGVYQSVTGMKSNEYSTNGRPHYNQLMTTQISSASDSVEQTTSVVGMIPKTLQLSDIENGTSTRANILCDEADQLLRAGQADEALTKYEQASTIAPTNVRAYRSCGVTHLVKKDAVVAESFFKKALQLSPQESKSLTGLATCRALKGNREEAFELLQQAITADPTNLTAIHKFLELAYMLERYSELEQTLDSYLVRNPSDIEMKYCLAGCAYKLTKFDKARRLVEEMLSVSNGDERAKELKALLDSQQVSRLSSGGVSQRHHNSVDEQLVVLEGEKKSRNYDSVISGGEKLLAQNGTNDNQKALTHVLIGEAYSQARNLYAADSHFRLAEDNEMHRVRAVIGRGVVAAAMEKWQEAETFFLKANALDSNNDIAIAGLGICAAQKGNSASAWDFYMKALTLNPENKRALLGIIQLGYSLGRLEDLEKVLTRYLELHPADLSMLYAHAGCCYAQGKRSLASTQLEKIKIFEPNHQLANELIARMSSEEGQTGSYR